MSTLGSSPSWNYWQYTLGSGANQAATSNYTMPQNGIVTAVVCYVNNQGGYTGANFRGCVWSSGGTLLTNSAANGSLPTGSDSVGGQSWITFPISNYYIASGTSIKIGWTRGTTGSTSMLWSTNTGGTGYEASGSSPGNLGSLTTTGSIGAYIVYTPITAPTATTTAATNITGTTATINGSFNDGGFSATGGTTSWDLYYSTSNTGPWTTGASGTFTGSTTELANITGLSGGPYYFYAKCSNSVGTSNGSVLSFSLADTPNAPINFTATPNPIPASASTVTFSWTYVSGGAAGGQTGYQLIVTNGQQVFPFTVTTYYWNGTTFTTTATWMSSESSSIAIPFSDIPLLGIVQAMVANEDANGQGPPCAPINLVADQPPFVPTGLIPANNAYADLSGTPTFSWTYNPNVTTTGQTNYAFREKVSGGSYFYWNAGTSSWGGSIVWNASTSWSITFPTGNWINNNTYNWSVATQDAGGQGAFATDQVLNAQAEPAVTVTAPSGATQQTNPTVTWSVTIAAGCTRVSYQVRTFSAAQYGAAGFNPATSTATDDSGVVSSSTATSYQIATGLIPGTTYQSYVNIIQTGPQGNNFDQYTNFNVQADVPATPTFTASYESDPITGCPMIQLTATCQVNLLSDVDASFESGIGTYTGTNATLSQSTSHAFDGAYSLRVASVGTGTYSAVSGTYAVQPSTVYSAMGMNYNSASGRTTGIAINWLNSSGGAISTSSGTTSGSVASTFTQYTAPNFTSPSNAAYADVVLISTSSSGVQSSYWDAIGLINGNTTTWSAGGLGSSASLVITRSDGLYVRNASAANPLSFSPTTFIGTVNDYECTPGVAYSYSCVLQATGDYGLVQSIPAIAGASVPTGLGFWELDPTNPGSAINAQPTQWNPQNWEQSAAHPVLGQNTVNIVASVMQVSDIQGSFDVFSAAIYQGIYSLLISQKTIFVSDPYGFSYYFRFALTPGGLAVGTGNKANDTQLQASSAGGPYRQIGFTGLGQPRVPV